MDSTGAPPVLCLLLLPPTRLTGQNSLLDLLHLLIGKHHCNLNDQRIVDLLTAPGPVVEQKLNAQD